MRTDGNTYLITGPTGKVYAGQTVDPATRWSVHKHLGTHKNNKDGYNYIHRAMRKHGAENFTFTLLNSGLTKEQMNNQEKVLITLFQANTAKYGYNLTNGGDGVWGAHYSPERLEKLAAEGKKRWQNPEYREKVCANLKGRKAWNKGRTLGAEYGARVSQGLRDYWSTQPSEVRQQKVGGLAKTRWGG